MTTTHTRTMPATPKTDNRNRVVVMHAIGAHLTPTKRKRKDANGQPIRCVLQGRCKVCSKKSSYICSLCKSHLGEESWREPWYCHPKNGGRDCFQIHCVEDH